MAEDISFINKKHFRKNIPLSYEKGWRIENSETIVSYIWDDSFADEYKKEQSWSSEIEKIHEEPTKSGWIDIYERQQVKKAIKDVLGRGKDKLIVEFGASVGYMIEEIKKEFPTQRYIATDIMPDGLEKSYLRNNDIYHVQCDFTDAPFNDNSIDVVYALNVLEHITDDVTTITECYRILKKVDIVCL